MPKVSPKKAPEAKAEVAPKKPTTKRKVSKAPEGPTKERIESTGGYVIQH